MPGFLEIVSGVSRDFPSFYPGVLQVFLGFPLGLPWFSRGVLEVFVTHSALVQEMGFHKHEVIQKLQSLLPSEGITDIRCRLLIEAGQK